MRKKPYRVDLSPEHQNELKIIKDALGLDSEAEALRAAIRLAYQFLKQRGIIQD